MRYAAVRLPDPFGVTRAMEIRNVTGNRELAAKSDGPGGWDPMPIAVVALGITQIVAWGTTLYALGVLAAPIAAETGWSRGLIFLGLTVGLLAQGILSTQIGRWTDRHGGRIIMSLGSALIAVGLMLLSRAASEWQYLAAWAVLGPGMRMTLYDAAFASLVQVTPSRGRRAISYLTLFGGFASSVFWPIGHVLAEAIGWRGTCLVYAALNLGLCLPLHLWGLARQEVPGLTAAANDNTAENSNAGFLEGRSRTLAMILFALAVSSVAFVIGAMSVHLPPLLQAHGLSATVAVTLASIKGVAQVAGRVGEIAWGKRLHALDLGRLAIGLMPLAFMVLTVGGLSFNAALAFTILFGISNGLITIVRGAVPLALFGRDGYGTILGILATPYLILNALAPSVFALLVEWGGYRSAEMLLIAAGLAALLAMELMAFWYRRLIRTPPSAGR